MYQIKTNCMQTIQEQQDQVMSVGDQTECVLKQLESQIAIEWSLI